MAEGGVPKAFPKSKVQNFPIEDFLEHRVIKGYDSKEHVFSTDLITYVMRRRIPSWDFCYQFGGQSSVAKYSEPFSFKIRNAVERYLKKEGVDIYVLFTESFSGLPLNYHSFTHVASWLVECVARDVHSMNDLLRLLALLTHFTTLAYKRGVHMAPYYTLIVIQDLLSRYIIQNGIYPHAFYANLGIHAERMASETSLVPK